MSSMRAKQEGFNLIETMIAMVILSIGLLGIAGLQLMGVRANQGSYFRSQATAIMTDASERLHNNLAGVRAGSYSNFDSNGFGCGAPQICAQENGGAAPTACTPQQMAAYDLFVLACGMRGAGAARVDRIADLLPTGRIRVNCIDNATPANNVAGAACQQGFRHQIVVNWAERVQAGGANPQEQTMETQTITLIVQP